MSDFNDDFDDFDDFEDDAFANLDDLGGAESLTPQQEQRLAKFQTNVKQAMRVVSNENASSENRVKAAKWLGESGEPTSITALRQAYLNTPDKKVKKAAEESLGMFRALQKALDDPEKAGEVDKLLKGIIFEGQMGSASGAATLVRRLQILLVITFVLIMGVGLLSSSGALSSDTVPTLAPTGTTFLSPTPLPTVAPSDFLDDLLTMHDDLVFDAELLAQRFQLSIQEENLGCDVTTFRKPDEYTPPAGFDPDSFPLVVEFVDKLNTAQAELDTLRQSYDQACASGTPISPEDADEQWGLLVPLQTQLNTEFVAMLENPDFIPGQAIATPTPRPSPTPFPTATIEPSVINQIILQVQFNVNDMNQNIIGKNNRLIQFWADLELAGRTDGCRDGTPLLPEDYLLEEGDRDELPIDLLNAIDAYNLGMTLSRDSWALFEIACAAEEPNTQQGKSQAELAKVSFDESEASLAKLGE